MQGKYTSCALEMDYNRDFHYKNENYLMTKLERIEHFYDYFNLINILKSS